jgi:hypothetical protein
VLQAPMLDGLLLAPFVLFDVLCHLKAGSLSGRVFRRRISWLGKEFWREGIEVYGSAEVVRHQAG